VLGDVPSTKTALTALATVAASPKVLVVLHRDDDLAWLSLRNAASVHAIAVDQLNAYDVLVNDEVVFTTAALQAYVSGPAKGRSAKAVATGSEADELDGYETPETSAEPSNADLAATAAVVAEVVEADGTEAEEGEQQ
jgi:large subunit ribosomal protein L4